jgi:hypothetical protein
MLNDLKTAFFLARCVICQKLIDTSPPPLYLCSHNPNNSLGLITHKLSHPNLSLYDIRARRRRQETEMDKTSQPALIVADAGEYEKEPIKAEIPLQRQRLERSLGEQIEERRIYAKKSVQNSESLTDFEVSEILSRTLNFGRPSVANEAEQAVGDDTSAKATDGLFTPDVSDVQTGVKPEEEIDLWMGWARTESNLNNARYYLARAGAVAKKYNLPIPELSDDEVRVSAKLQRDYKMKCALDSLSVEIAIAREREAQDMAKKWDIPTTELSYAEIKQLRQREIDIKSYQPAPSQGRSLEAFRERRVTEGKS